MIKTLMWKILHFLKRCRCLQFLKKALQIFLNCRFFEAFRLNFTSSGLFCVDTPAKIVWTTGNRHGLSSFFLKMFSFRNYHLIPCCLSIYQIFIYFCEKVEAIQIINSTIIWIYTKLITNRLNSDLRKNW